MITLFIASHNLLAANHTLPCEVEITALRRKHLGNWGKIHKAIKTPRNKKFFQRFQLNGKTARLFPHIKKAVRVIKKLSSTYFVRQKFLSSKWLLTMILRICQFIQGFWYFAEKKNRPISWDFRRRKVHIRRKIGRFRGILAEKVKFRRIFREKFSEKSADFTGNFGEKLSQETICKKQPILLDFFGQISLKSINFASIWPALVNVSFNRNNHLLFQQQFARGMSECLSH